MLTSSRPSLSLWWLQELLLQTNRIKEKATQSEAIVRDITRDIQTLDKGKKNLMASITILKRLQMLGELAPLTAPSHPGANSG